MPERLKTNLFESALTTIGSRTMICRDQMDLIGSLVFDRTRSTVHDGVKPMTFEKSQMLLESIRRQQRTDKPLVKVHYAGTVFQGRVARTDGNITRCREHGSPYGLMVLEHPGLGRGPETILQIAQIPDDGLVSAQN